MIEFYYDYNDPDDTDGDGDGLIGALDQMIVRVQGVLDHRNWYSIQCTEAGARLYENRLRQRGGYAAADWWCMAFAGIRFKLITTSWEEPSGPIYELIYHQDVPSTEARIVPQPIN